MLLRICAAATLLAAVAFVPAPASAGAIMSVNNRSLDDVSTEQCLRRARATIKSAGFKYHDATSQAIWGLANDGRDMVVIYCPTREIAIFVAASPTGKGSVTEPLVNRLTDAWSDDR